MSRFLGSGIALLALSLKLWAQPTSAPADSSPERRFVDVSATTGVSWRHENGDFGQRWLPETLGPGVLIFDANGDRHLDLLFVNGRGFPGKPGPAATPALYLNQGGMRFSDATAASGLSLSAYCLGGAAADIDNDGDTDVFLSCVGQDILLRNDGAKFVDVSRAAGLVESYELAASAAFFDADRDGFVDLFVTRYVRWTPETDQHCSFFGSGKSYCTPIVYEGLASRFYRNKGNGTFDERTQAAGLHHASSKALGVVPVDLDGDRWVDLVVACDTYQNLVFRNRGNGTFEDIGLTAGIALSLTGQPRGGMGIDAGDFNRGGRQSLVITYFSREMTGLYLNQGDNFFLDLGSASEVGRKTESTVGWGTFFFDFDLDGWLDLLVANGHLDAKAESPQSTGKHAQPQQLFANRGKGEFQEVTGSSGGDLARPLVGRGAAFGDLDEDGDLDVVITTNAGTPRIFENRGPAANWLRIRLQGTRSNRDGLGAEVAVTIAGARQTWQVRAGGSYLSQSEISPTFGLGGSGTVDTVEVRWPSGAVQTIGAVRANQVLEVVEPVSPSESAAGSAQEQSTGGEG